MDQRDNTQKQARFITLDIFRGLLIILMALDHANYLIAQQHSSGEYWGGYFPSFESLVHFMTRFVTHLCAPGFFFLMGAGMALFKTSRRKMGWKDAEIRQYFLIRGLILIAVQLALNIGRVWGTGGTSFPLWYGGVLAALGAGMIFTSLLINVKPIILGAIAAWFFIVMEILTPSPVMWGRNFDQLAGVWLVYGGGVNGFWVNYPLLAWVELIVSGMLFGHLLEKRGKNTYRWGAWTGLVFLIGFVLLRGFNGFGTIRPLESDTWMGFLSVVKYPPSMVYVLLTTGINLILLWALSFWQDKEISSRNPLVVFGQTPLFSYVIHIVIYLVLGRIFVPGGTSLGIMYLYWLLGLVLLYFPARWYGNYRISQPSRSWIRML